MSARGRLIVLGLLIVGVAVTIGTLAPSDPNEGERLGPVDLSTSDSCRECHEEVWKEWKESYHSQATTMPYVLELSRNFEDTSCLPCHRPAPIFDGKYGRIPAKRFDRHEEGVDCLSCHALPGGRVAAARDDVDPNAPCRPTVVRENGVNLLTAIQHCAGCHNQHETLDEWMASEYGPAKAGDGARDCMDCHMETVRREGGRIGRSHRFPASHDLTSLKSAVELTAVVEGPRLVVSTKNVGAGHHIPTDARHRSFNVLVRVEDEHGNVRAGWTEIAEYRLYYREQYLDSTQIASGETATATFALPGGIPKGRVIVRLYYCLVPTLADDLRRGRFDDPNLYLVEERVVSIDSG